MLPWPDGLGDPRIAKAGSVIVSPDGPFTLELDAMLLPKDTAEHVYERLRHYKLMPDACKASLDEQATLCARDVLGAQRIERAECVADAVAAKPEGVPIAAAWAIAGSALVVGALAGGLYVLSLDR